MGWFGSSRKDGTRPFGVTDILVCPRCGSDTYISRRTPHPERGLGFELQTFTCPMCDYEHTRTADQDGDVMRAK